MHRAVLLRYTPSLFVSKLSDIFLILRPECPFSFGVLEIRWLIGAFRQLLAIFQFLMQSVFDLDLPAFKLNFGNYTKIKWFVWVDSKAQVFKVDTCPGVMTLCDVSLDTNESCDPPTKWQQLLEKRCSGWIKNSL